MDDSERVEEKSLTVAQELTPSVWKMLEGIGRAFAGSQKMGIHTPEEGAVRALFCLENQLPLTAARGLYFVSGKLGIESGVIAALIRRHPDYDYNIKELSDTGCTIEITRFDEVIGEASFGDKDAKRAGLDRKDTYKKYPQDLYFAKAITRAQRRYAPDVFMAPVYSSEEMSDWDVIDVEPLPPLPEKRKPTLAESIQAYVDEFGADLCFQAGVITASNEDELFEAASQLSILAASKEFEGEKSDGQGKAE